MNQVSALTAILLLSWLCEALVEYLARPLVRRELPVFPAPVNGEEGKVPEPKPDDTAKEAVLRKPPILCYTAALLGVLLAIAYHADLLALVGLVSPVSPYVGYVVTGLVIGRGSNFLHDLADRWLVPGVGKERRDEEERRKTQVGDGVQGGEP
jgi:hypothetical protein